MYALKTSILYLLLTTLSATCLKAQEQFQNNRFGNVSGIVSESIDGETLIGVNLLIKGTSLGTSTDEYGEYLIRRIPEGEQILIVSYIGYESIERTINVISGENTVINFTLKPQTLEGQEVVVSSQASGQKSAINEQINSRTIKNVVSAEKIRELPDASAATAISRLPGVSLEGHEKSDRFAGKDKERERRSLCFQRGRLRVGGEERCPYRSQQRHFRPGQQFRRLPLRNQ